MAIVKVYFRKSAERVLRYVFGHTQPGDPADSENCPPHAEGAITEFKTNRDLHDFKNGNNEVLHIIQSWNEEDSNRLTPQTINAMGKELVGNYFKDHQFVVVTHTETGKIHNHIVVGTTNLVTGKQVTHKFSHLHELRKINDQLCLARGLKIPNQEANQRKARIPDRVQNMVRMGKQSWLYDTMNKADVARHLATSYDQYVDYMDAFGIRARVEDKNITYFYSGRSRGKRGDNLGKHYDKPGLEAQFKMNDARFREQPEIRSQLLQSLANQKPTGGPSGASQRDYGQFTKNQRRTPHLTPLSERELTQEMVSSGEIRKAKRSISDYCIENNIAINKHPQGHYTLRDKPYIMIQDTEALNTRNGTRGSLIDFVAAHHRLTLLQAVAKINGSQEPLLFENNFGAIPRKYTSFYVPKADQMPHLEAKEHLGRFLKRVGSHPQVAESLMRSQRAEVSRNGTIRLFADSDPGGALEFTPGTNQEWKEKKQGEFRRPFYQHNTKRNRLQLFLEPKTYLQGGSSHLFDARHHRDGILVLMEPNKDTVDHYLKENPSVKQIHGIPPKGRKLFQAEIDFFGVLKNHLHTRGIELVTQTHDRSIAHDGPSLGL